MIINFNGGISKNEVQNMITSATQNYTTTAYTQDLELSVAGSLNLEEKLGNKVTTITSASTNTQYASAKSVYDLVDGEMTSVNNQLNNI